MSAPEKEQITEAATVWVDNRDLVEQLKIEVDEAEKQARLLRSRLATAEAAEANAWKRLSEMRGVKS